MVEEDTVGDGNSEELGTGQAGDIELKLVSLFRMPVAYKKYVSSSRYWTDIVRRKLGKGLLAHSPRTGH